MSKPKKQGATVPIASRVTPDDAESLYRYARKHGTTVADLIREGLLKLEDVHLSLSPEPKK